MCVCFLAIKIMGYFSYKNYLVCCPFNTKQQRNMWWWRRGGFIVCSIQLPRFVFSSALMVHPTHLSNLKVNISFYLENAPQLFEVGLYIKYYVCTLPNMYLYLYIINTYIYLKQQKNAQWRRHHHIQHFGTLIYVMEYSMLYLSPN